MIFFTDYDRCAFQKHLFTLKKSCLVSDNIYLLLSRLFASEIKLFNSCIFDPNFFILSPRSSKNAGANVAEILNFASLSF